MKPIKYPLVAYRNADVSINDRLLLEGYNFANHKAKLQVRLYAGQPGEPLIRLSTEAGMAIDVDLSGTLPVTVITMIIDNATILGLPQEGEAGDDAQFAYDLVLIPPAGGGPPFRLFYGTFTVSEGVTR